MSSLILKTWVYIAMLMHVPHLLVQWKSETVFVLYTFDVAMFIVLIFEHAHSAQSPLSEGDLALVYCIFAKFLCYKVAVIITLWLLLLVHFKIKQI